MPFSAAAHPGDLDEFGGHFSEKSGIYHYHRPKAEMAQRKREYVTWTSQGQAGELRGTVIKVERPDALWVKIPYRPAYQELARRLTAANRDDNEQRVKVWFLFVSPEASVSRGREYTKWFRKKVIYELDQKLRGKDVVVQFRMVQEGRRMYGMVLQGQENINLWLVLNGWSYQMLSHGDNPFAKEFTQAEALARRDKSGLWQTAR